MDTTIRHICSKLEEFPIEVVYSPEKGRYVVSKDDLQAKTLVFRVYLSLIFVNKDITRAFPMLIAYSIHSRRGYVSIVSITIPREHGMFAASTAHR